MEGRLLLSTIVVTGTGDEIANDGIVTLREAITAANTDAASGDAIAGDAGLDTIDFNIPGPGVHTITLESTLPTITEPRHHRRLQLSRGLARTPIPSPRGSTPFRSSVDNGARRGLSAPA